MLCTSPVLIINRSLVTSIQYYTHYHTPDSDVCLNLASKAKWSYSFPYALFSPRKNNVTPENYKDYYFYNCNTGNTIPIYMLVPCGHCDLCREKKKSEWEFRAICENAVSETQPLFVTCTYDPQHLPEEGLCKRDIQLFLKRLRFNLVDAGYDVSYKLRYFACGEYGSRTKRPHYHLILWNFPDMKTLHARLQFVSDAWKNGYCYVVPVTTGGIGYVMKYMRKSVPAPVGKSPVFFLSSRRNGGIGSKYLMDRFSFFHDNPSQIKVSVTDPYTGVTKTSILPKFFRDKLWPSFVRSVDGISRTVLRRFRENLHICRTLYDSIKDYFKVFPPMSWRSFELLKKYGSFCCYNISRDWTMPSYLRKLSVTAKLSIYNRCHCILNECADYFKYSSDIDTALIKENARLKSIFSSYLGAYVDSLPEVDLSHSIISLNNAKKLAYSREIF